jgi:hypothetical protein
MPGRLDEVEASVSSTDENDTSLEYPWSLLPLQVQSGNVPTPPWTKRRTDGLPRLVPEFADTAIACGSDGMSQTRVYFLLLAIPT